MKINSIVLPNLLLKLILGSMIFIAGGIDRQHYAVASTFNFQRDNSYNLLKIEDFNLNLNRNLSNQLEQELLQENLDFSEYVNLVIQKANDDHNSFHAELNILSQNAAGEERLFNSLLLSLRNLELQRYSNNRNSSSSITVLSQVNYQDIYQDVYDFDITLTDSPRRVASQATTPERLSPGNLILTGSLLGYNYSNNSSQNSGNYADYRLPNSEPREITNSNYSLLASPQQNLSVSGFLPSSSTNLPLAPNRNISSFVSNAPVNTSSLLGNIRTGANNLNSNQDYSEISDISSRIKSIGAAVSIPSTEIKAYKLQDFKNVPSNLNSYQKPEYQQNIEVILESQKKDVEKQREQLYENIKKLQEKRRIALEKQRQEYRKKRQKELQNAIKQQRKLQQQRQAQYR